MYVIQGTETRETQELKLESAM